MGFMILTVNGRHLPQYSVQTNAVNRSNTTLRKRAFDTYSDLENFVRTVINPKVLPYVTLYFGQR